MFVKMSKIQSVRGLILQRLSAAAEEIFELFERTIAEYEEQLCRSKEEQHKHLEDGGRSHTADVLQLLVRTEEVPPDQQEWSRNLDQEDKPEPARIKEEQEEPWSREEREQLQGLEEETRELLTEASQLHDNQPEETTEGLKTDSDDEDFVKPEPDRDFNPDNHLEPFTGEETSHSEPETFVSSPDFEEVNKVVMMSDGKYNTRKKSVNSSDCGTCSGQKGQVQKGGRIQRDEKPFHCSICGKRFCTNKNLLAHKICHLKNNRYKCSVCKKSFFVRLELERHMRSHTGEKPYGCSVCGKSFTQKSNLFRHQRIHTREKPFSCSLCDASFRQKTHLARHTRTHTGERPFSCSVCRKSFSERGTLQRHLTIHTEQKLFVCNVCDRRFTRLFSLVRHKCQRSALS